MVLSPREGLTDGQRAATFVCYIFVVLVLRVLHFRSSSSSSQLLSPSDGISSPSKCDAVPDKSEIETLESRRLRTLLLKIFRDFRRALSQM